MRSLNLLCDFISNCLWRRTSCEYTTLWGANENQQKYSPCYSRCCFLPKECFLCFWCLIVCLIGFAVKADFRRLYWLSIITSERQQRATHTIAIAPRWKPLWRQHVITSGRWPVLWPVSNLPICSRMANPIIWHYVVLMFPLICTWFQSNRLPT